MFNFKTLENTNIEVVHEAFVCAFSDYEVKIDLPLWKFKQMLRRRGYAPQMSIGAFADDALVGFVLNGQRKWNGYPTVYDIGTAVVKEYRKQGITSNILPKMKELMKENGIEYYLLEVLQSNKSAFELYKKQGFEITREFACFKLDKNNYIPSTSFEVQHVERFDETEWEQLTVFWDYTPSWQNSIDSVNAAADIFVYSIVRVDAKIVGYGIIDKKTGDIPQIAVDRQYRGKGIARSIIADLLKNTESKQVGILNVDEQFKSAKNFLIKSGFEYSVAQYEMILKL